MKLKRWLKRSLVAGITLGLIAAVALWMLFQHIPRWYTPVVVPEKEYQRVRDDLLDTEDDFTHRLMTAQPFTFTLSDRQINEWVATRHAIWQPAARWIPPQIQNPVIQFRPGTVVLAGLLRHDDAKVIASVHLSFEVVEDRICVKLLRVQGGSLPLPADWLIERATQYWREHAKDRRRPDSGKHTLDDDEIIRQLAALPDGAYFPNGLRWPNGKREFAVESLTFDEGTCTFRVRPETPAYPTR